MDGVEGVGGEQYQEQLRNDCVVVKTAKESGGRRGEKVVKGEEKEKSEMGLEI